MSEPTGGNWRYEGGRVLSDAPTGIEAAMPIADLWLAFKSSAEMHANGALLAASKRLLAVCERVAELTDGTFSEEDRLENLESIGEQARAAIASATKGDA